MELLPIIEKELFSEYFTASIAVSVPTSAIIPNAMINMVNEALNFWLLIACTDMAKFSFVVTLQNYISLP